MGGGRGQIGNKKGTKYENLKIKEKIKKTLKTIPRRDRRDSDTQGCQNDTSRAEKLKIEKKSPLSAI